MSFEEAQAVRDDGEVTKPKSDITWLSEDEEGRFWNSSVDYDDDEPITFNSIACSSVRGFFSNERKKDSIVLCFSGCISKDRILL